jgi:mxaJ protein
MRWSLLAGSACAMLCLGAPAAGQPAAADAGPGQDKVLRVCQDPNNMPLSNSAQAGFENRIAALFAQELGWKLEHTWYPQRMGFIRNTLRAKVDNSDRFKCDLVTGVPKGFDLAATTRPYYRSSYAIAYVKGKGLDKVHELDDLLALDAGQRKKLRIGAFAGSPVTEWLLQHGFAEQVAWYQSQTGDKEQYPGEIVEKDLANGKIDVAFAWGPIAGYFAKNARAAPIVAFPLRSRPGMKLDFEIAMAVRHADKEFRQRIDGLIAADRAKIHAILEQYGVPLLEEQAPVAQSSQP